MSFSANRLIIAGNLTRDPESRQITPDRQVVNFGIAINQRTKGADGEAKDNTIFLDCEAWGRTGELVMQYLTKGSGAYIEGRLKQDQWEDKDSGQRRTKIRVIAEIVRFTGNARHGEDDADTAQDPADTGDHAPRPASRPGPRQAPPPRSPAPRPGAVSVDPPF